MYIMAVKAFFHDLFFFCRLELGLVNENLDGKRSENVTKSFFRERQSPAKTIQIDKRNFNDMLVGNINIAGDVELQLDALATPRENNFTILENTQVNLASNILNITDTDLRIGDIVNIIPVYTASPLDGIVSTIKYKLRFSDNWRGLPTRVNKKIKHIALQYLLNLYEERIKIKKTKFQYLHQLKETISSDYHAYYDNIPYQE